MTQPEPTHTCTCHTEGCDNNGDPIPMILTWTELDEWGDEQTYTAGSVVCGPCGEPITDITDIKPGGEVEPRGNDS